MVYFSKIFNTYNRYCLTGKIKQLEKIDQPKLQKNSEHDLINNWYWFLILKKVILKN